MNYKSLFLIFTTTKIQYATPLSVEDIIARLQEITEPKRRFLFLDIPNYKKPYIGEVKARTFEFIPKSNNSRSSQPLIKGIVTSTANGSVINLEIKSNALVGEGLALIFLLCLGAAWEIGSFILGNDFNAMVLGIPVLCGIMLLFSNLQHHDKINKHKYNLSKVFQAKPKNITLVYNDLY